MQISTRLILGGSQEHVLLTCEGLCKAGHEVCLVYGPIYGPEGSLFDQAVSKGYSLFEIKELVRPLNLYKDWVAYKKIRKLIRKWNPDVVHTNSSKAGILGRVAAAHEKVRCVVHTVHGLPFHSYQCAVFNTMYVFAEKFAAKKSNKIFVVADALREEMTNKKIGMLEQYSTIRSGLKIQSFINANKNRKSIRQGFGFTEDDFVVGTISRISSLKGHHDLLNAMPAIIKKCPRVKLLWVGDGWLRDKVFRKACKMGLEKNIYFTGLVPPSSIPKMLSVMDLLVHPSWREGLPRAVVQAMIARVPVVASDANGTKEVVINNKTGWLIDIGDHVGLSKSVIDCMFNHTKRDNLINNAFDLTINNFSSEKMVEETLLAYKLILEEAF